MPSSAVADTSILVSAFLFPNSVPGRVLTLAEQGIYTLYFSPIILEEFNRSVRNPRLRKSYSYTDEEIDRWYDDLHNIGNAIAKSLPDIGPICRDPDDDHVIAAALAVKADYIVTGDKDLLVLEQHQNIRIVTAKSFLAESQ